MKPEQDRGKLFTRRALILGGSQAMVFVGLAGRMYYLQVSEAKRYQVLAEDNRISLRLLPPLRGRILDRQGVPLAINIQNYTIEIIPEEAGDVSGMLERLSGLVEVSDGDKKRIMKETRRRRAFVPIKVRENLSWEEVSRIEVNTPDLPGISIKQGQTRYYPYGPAVAHVLGYVAAVSEREQTGDSLLQHPGFRIGKNGVERQHDLALRGSAGNVAVEVNALGRQVQELKDKKKEARSGAQLKLTIDMGVQEAVAKRVKDARRAAVVAMDVHNGDILTMVSTPSFDPNAFNEGLSGDAWRSLITNPDHPLTNKAIAGQYAPGSTFKIAAALAALESGVPASITATCYGSMQLGDRKFHCWKKHGHGTVDLVDAIRESCDIYFYELALRVGIDKIGAMARRLGLGSTLGIDIPGERGGLIPSKDWKRATIGVAWQRGETLVAGIGQGFVLATPLQLAVMASRVVNGGFAVTPRLTVPEETDDLTPPSGFPKLGISARALRIVRQGMDEVVNNPRGGTAYGARIAKKKFAMGGKTGTSQVRRISMAERDKGVRKNKDRPWRERDHALFVGYAPVNAPRYAVSVVVEHGGGGSKAAAPIARDVLHELQRRDPTLNPRKVATSAATKQKKPSR
jgi:penicillin-binding protein 2